MVKTLEDMVVQEWLEPLDDRLVLRSIKEPDRTEAGLYIPEQAREKPMRGEVIAVGGSVQRLQVGDVVYYGRYSGAEIEFNGEPLIVLKERDVLARVREEIVDNDDNGQ